jgi:predicted MFS family arabinose efflux permease
MMTSTTENAGPSHGEFREPTKLDGEFRQGGSVLLAATIGSAGSLTSLGYYSLGSFIAPLQSEFGWNRGDVASSFLYTTIVMALLSPLMGLMIDRLGVRRTALVSIPALAVVFLALGRFQGSLTSFHLLYALAAIAGAGTTPISYTRAVNGAFDRSRGLALGISQAGIALAAIAVPLLMAVAIPHGWRTGYILLAVLTLVPWLFVFFGMRTPASQRARTAPASGYSVRDAIGTGVFWAVGISFAAIAVAISALVVHLVPLLRDAGVMPMRAAATASFIGVGVLVGRIAGGYLIDRFFAPFVATALFLLAACGCLMLLLGGTDMAVVAAGLMGFALGAEADLIAYITARYFGLARYGVLYSIIYSMFVLGGAIGPTLAGRSFDATGNYNAALWGVVTLLIAASFAIARLPRFEDFASRRAGVSTSPPTRSTP